MKGFVWLTKRVDELEDRVRELESKQATHEFVDRRYVDMIHTQVKVEVWKAVEKALQCPIEMTVSDIEKAFGHKIKIVEGDRE